MKKKTIIIIISVAFCGGILFSGLAFVAFSRSQPLLNKIVSKLKEKRIAMIPRAKEILMLSDFENEADFARWDTADATIEQSPEHASHGANAARITFLPSGGAAAIKIEKYFEKEPSLGNWGGHEVLCMDIYNPNPKTERMLLKLRDAKEYKTTIDIFLEPQKMNKVEIDIAGLWGKINPTRISQLNLFLWDNKSAKTFYIDNVRLLPAAALEKNTVNILNAEFYPQAGEQAYATGDYFSFDQTRWGKVDPQTGDSFIEIPLVLINDTSVPTATQMFTGGVPFPKGELTDDAKVGLYDRQGSRLSIQTKVAAWWPDKSIKWLLVSVPTSLGADEKKPLYLRYGKAIASESKRNVSMVSESAGVVIINTGSLKALISKKQAFLFDAVWIDANHDKAFSEDEEIAKNIDLVLGHNHKVFKSSLDRSAQITVEEDGPEQACVKLEGWFVNERKQKFCKFIARVFAYRNASYLKVQHTFVYTGYPENKYHYLYKGKWLPKNETIDQISVIVPFSLRGAAQLTFAADEKILQSTVSDSITFSQSAYNEYSLTKNNQVIGTGRKLAGWFDLGNEAQGIAVGVKNLWEQFPKGFSFDKEKTLLQIDLWPRAAGAIDLKTIASAIGPDDVARGSAFGLAKTHELYFYFHRKDYALAKVKDTMVGLLSDTLLMADPQWIAATKVLGMVSAFDARAGSGEQFLSKLFDWAERQKKNFHWYGMLDFGDTLTWYRKEGFDKSYDEWGWHPEGRHGWFNCEAIGTHGGALMQFLRTGNAKYFLYGAQLARHIMDVDTCHYNTIAN
ncbi:MAG: hypothetical protein KBA46_05905, partial [Candidatus Omnitrophica bacterium]|nr:hypothetical protein [Candidatus Omnitrophota bacterium]